MTRLPYNYLPLNIRPIMPGFDPNWQYHVESNNQFLCSINPNRLR